MAPLQPISGQETLEDLGCEVRWATQGDDHRSVVFDVTFGKYRGIKIRVSSNGNLHFTPEPLNGFTSAPSFRKAVSLVTWCYRTAYKEVFKLQDIDQLLFL